jgi:Uma2 family endonuclease
MLVQEQPTQSKQMTLDEFLDWYPEGEGRFELQDETVIEIQATGTHEKVGGLLALEVGVEIKRLTLPYFIPRQGIIKAIDSDKSGYSPDVMVLDWQQIETEPMWKKRSTIIRGENIRLVIEIVSTNWQNDYLINLVEYEKLIGNS